MTGAVSMGGVKARVSNAKTSVENTQGPIAQALADTETAIAELLAAMDGSDDAPAAADALGALMKLKELLEQSQQFVGAATTSLDGVLAWLH